MKLSNCWVLFYEVVAENEDYKYKIFDKVNFGIKIWKASAVGPSL